MGSGTECVAVDHAFTVNQMAPEDISQLAKDFVTQYYTMMKESPSGLHRFYEDDSTMIRNDTTIFGQRLIHEKIMSMSLGGVYVGILRLDALKSSKNSVLVQVSGELSTDNEEPRRFAQSFVLYEKSALNFYVLNDILTHQDYVYGDVKQNTYSVCTSAEMFSPALVHKVYGDIPQVHNLDVVSTASRINLDVFHEQNDNDQTWDTFTSQTDVILRTNEESRFNNNSPFNIEVSSPSSCIDTERAECTPPVREEAILNQPRSWAQMASMRPSGNAHHSQISKFSKVSSNVVSSKAEDLEREQTSSRQPNRTPNKRTQMNDGRTAAGDNGLAPDFRPSMQSSGRAGYPRGGNTGTRGAFGRGRGPIGRGNVQRRGH